MWSLTSVRTVLDCKAIVQYVVSLHPPAEEVALPTVYGGGPQQGEAEGVGGGGAGPGETHRPLAACHGAPADGRVVIHKRLRGTRRERERDMPVDSNWVKEG